MLRSLERFEEVVRRTPAFAGAPIDCESTLHPFDVRNIHQNLPAKVRKLFDDGHYSEATFAAFKYVDKLVQRFSKLPKSGEGLMMQAFSEATPLIKLTSLANLSETDEQRGFKFIFAGAAVAIRNPRGHENDSDEVDKCLDHLALASLLVRRLEEAGYVDK